MKKKRLLLLVIIAASLLCLALYPFVGPMHPKEKGDELPASNPGALPAPSAPARDGRDQWLGRVNDADVSELQALLDDAFGIQEPELRRLMVEAILARWMAEDTEGILVFLDQLEVSLAAGKLAIMYEGLERVLAHLHPDVAGRDSVLLVVERLISYLSDKDPERALVWAEKCLLDDARDNAIVMIVRGTAMTNVARALQIAGKIQSELRTMQALALIGASWAATDPQAALAWAKRIPSPGNKALTMNSIFLTLAREDAALAASELASIAGQITSEYLQKRRAILAENNLTEADEANATEVYIDLLNAGAIPGPESPDVELMKDAGKVIAAKLAEKDPAKSTSWAESLPGSHLRATVLAAAVEAWAGSSPLQALAYVRQRHPQDTLLLESVFTGWAATAPAAAAGNVHRLADPARQQAVLNQVFATWAGGSGVANAAEYLRQMPPNSVTDQMRLSVSQGLASVSPLDAWNIAKSIQNADAQTRALKQALSAMIFVDSAQAVQVFNSTDLPPGTKTALGRLLDAVGAR